MNKCAAENTGPETNQALRKRAVMISVMIGLLMLAMKMGAYLVTNSAAVLSDALESVVHVIATLVALYSIILIGRPADTAHPYGYGKAEFFSAGLEGALIVIAAIAIIYEAVGDIISGSNLRQLDIGVMVIASAGAINLVLGYYLVRTGRKTKSLAVIADGKHVLTDSFTSIGVVIGLLLVQLTGWTLLDPLFAIGVALNIIATGYQLVAESVRGLMNIADPEAMQRVVDVMNRLRTPEMLDMHRLRGWRSGDRLFIDFHLVLPEHYRLRDLHDIQNYIRDALHDEFGGEVEVMIHFDPCAEDFCLVCGASKCDHEDHRRTLDEPFTIARAQGSSLYSRSAEAPLEAG